MQGLLQGGEVAAASLIRHDTIAAAMVRNRALPTHSRTVTPPLLTSICTNLLLLSAFVKVMVWLEKETEPERLSEWLSALQLSPHHRLIQKQRVRHGNYQFINLVRIRVDLIYYLIQNFTAVLVLQQGPGHYRARADAGVAWCYHEMHSFPLFFFLE